MTESEKTIDNGGERLNRLRDSFSPYLRQHAGNPVDWYEWGDEAFEKARREDKPVFLSIGYSTCHWCHVMAEESFENEDIAAFLNEHFVSIKVDRERRPDVDHIYMSAVQAMTGAGGWPLTVFLAPDGRPFFGGTYFPPEDKFGRVGFMRLITAIARSWENERDKLLESAQKLTDALKSQKQPSPGEVGTEAPAETVKTLGRIYDRDNGGFGAAPKFSQPCMLELLTYEYGREGDEKAGEMLTHTLETMAAGGIYDHLAGGFHRYSTDEKWLVPHFEKMLYDQALLAGVYLNAYKLTGRQGFADIVRGVLDYVIADLGAPAAGFYSARDADSADPARGGRKHEGAYYVWRMDEVRELLEPDEAELIAEHFGMTQTGNFEGANVLYVAKTAEQLADEKGIDVEKLREKLSTVKQKLLEARSNRQEPSRDEKIITAWNAMTVSALARAGAGLGCEPYISAAQETARLILKHLEQQGRLARYSFNGESKGEAFAEDYAFTVNALLDLYEADFEPGWLETARWLSGVMVDRFYDERGGGFFMTEAGGDVLYRAKEDYDGVTPSGGSAGLMAMVRVWHITGDERLAERIEKTLRGYAEALNNSGHSLTYMLVAAGCYLGPRLEIVISGSDGNETGRKMADLLQRRYLPGTFYLWNKSDGHDVKLRGISPHAQNRAPRPIVEAYVCSNNVCKKPARSVQELSDQLQDN